MENWCWIPILLTLEHVEMGVIATNIIAMFLKCIILNGSWIKVDQSAFKKLVVVLKN